jgi:5-methylcytosine-specific restriction endonuclease McrA
VAPRPCLVCGTPSPYSRCPAHGRPTARARGYDRTHERIRRQVIGAWVARHGWVCPGYQRETHQVAENGLTADHIRPRSIYPELVHDPANYRVLCRSCNQRKSNRL